MSYGIIRGKTNNSEVRYTISIDGDVPDEKEFYFYLIVPYCLPALTNSNEKRPKARSLGHFIRGAAVIT